MKTPKHGWFAVAAGLLLLCAALCALAPAGDFPVLSESAEVGDYVQLQAADAFQYVAFNGRDKCLTVRTPQGGIALVLVSNRFYDDRLADLAYSHKGAPVLLAGRVVNAPADVIRFSADAANLSEEAFSARIDGLCVDTTAAPPAKRAAVCLVWAAVPFAALHLLLLKKARS